MLTVPDAEFENAPMKWNVNGHEHVLGINSIPAKDALLASADLRGNQSRE